MSVYSIYHDLKIYAPISKVFEGVSSPALLNEWWTNDCKGECKIGSEYELRFSQNCVWFARVTKMIQNREFELLMFNSHEDWDDTKIGFHLENIGDVTKLRFYHSDWNNLNEHFRISSYCWAVYLRILKGYLEKGIRIAYDERDSI